jgi:hypothetical protein
MLNAYRSLARKHARVFFYIRAGIAAQNGGCYLALDSVPYQASCQAIFHCAFHCIMKMLPAMEDGRTKRYFGLPSDMKGTIFMSYRTYM